MGSASYAPENDALVWKIKSFPGGKVLMSKSSQISCASIFVYRGIDDLEL